LLCLGGCVASHPMPRQFDLGDLPERDPRSGELAVNLIIPDVTQPSWIRTRDIFYRLDYESSARPQRYTLNKWVATPGELVTLRLRQALQSANRGFTVSAPNGVAGYLLQTNIDEFTQVFVTPKDSGCIFQLRATLWKPDGQIRAQRAFRLALPAPTPDAGGAARCLATAVDRENDEIIQWLGAVATAT